MFYNSPSDRRAYIDAVISRFKPTYKETLSQYKRALLQRNNLLKKQNTNQDNMFVWEVRLAELAKIITENRTQYIRDTQEDIQKIYQTISQTDTKLEIEYQTAIATQEQYTTLFLKNLAATLQRDKHIGHTSIGPHKDDILFYTHGSGTKQVASRGEIRTILLALKVLEAQKIEQHFKQKPIILLDDVFSELDGTRRKQVAKAFSDYQTFITTTDADIITKTYTQHSNVILL
jgi:DNA replication and repair protein RecF